ncbi:transposase family protein [Nocardiopsis sp. FR4]|uniref:transposase family protein n=1 Tax=Nocardiopsis sp. FR4 TaxID=2605985 RepID=UPI001915D51D|nr:transposase family protein [Nocardiopsis sp. FR4]
MTIKANHAVLAHPRLTGISQHHLAALVEKLARPWEAAVKDHQYQVRVGARKRAAGAGAGHRLVFVDRLVATLIHLRHDLPHAVLGRLFGVDRSTVTRAGSQIRVLLAERGCAVPNRPGVRLPTLSDVFAYAQAEGVELRLDATEVQVRRPRAGRGGQRAFVAGKKKQDTMKATVVADHRGRTLWTGFLRPGRMHDATAVRLEGIDACFRHFSEVEVLLDDGYFGLRRDHPGQAITPPRKPNRSALPEFHERWKHHRHTHSSDRITVEHALADHKRWKQLTRWTHRHENLPGHRRTGLRPHREHLKSTADGATTPHPLSRTHS